MKSLKTILKESCVSQVKQLCESSPDKIASDDAIQKCTSQKPRLGKNCDVYLMETGKNPFMKHYTMKQIRDDIEAMIVKRWSRMNPYKPWYVDIYLFDKGIYVHAAAYNRKNDSAPFSFWADCTSSGLKVEDDEKYSFRSENATTVLKKTFKSYDNFEWGKFICEYTNMCGQADIMLK